MEETDDFCGVSGGVGRISFCGSGMRREVGFEVWIGLA